MSGPGWHSWGLLACAWLACTPGGKNAGTAPTVEATIRGHPLTLEVAADPDARARGLRFRRELPDNGGMLFVLAQDSMPGFDMGDTYLPLSIAFVTSDSVILNVADMEPFDGRTLHRASGPVRYAIQVQQGWFEQHGIEPGDVVHFQLPASLPVH
jgi:hypothetical protein